jgi:hypothetical protein
MYPIYSDIFHHFIFDHTGTTSANTAESVHPIAARGPPNQMQTGPPPLVEITSLFSPPTLATPTPTPLPTPPLSQPRGLIRVQVPVPVQGPSSAGTYVHESAP